MIEVQLADGTVVEFPDGTSEDVMRGALSRIPQASAAAPVAETEGPESPGVLRRTGDHLAGFAATLAEIPGTLVDAVDPDPMPRDEWFPRTKDFVGGTSKFAGDFFGSEGLSDFGKDILDKRTESIARENTLRAAEGKPTLEEERMAQYSTRVADVFSGASESIRGLQSDYQKGIDEGLGKAINAGVDATIDYIKKYPSVISTTFISSLPYMFGSAGAARVSGKIAEIAKGSEAVVRGSKIAGSIAGETGLVSLSTADQARQAIDQIPDGVLAQLPEYQEILKATGGDTATTRAVLRDRAGNTAFGTNLLTNLAVLGASQALGANVVQDVLAGIQRKTSGNAVVRAGKGAAKEFVQEAVQEPGDTLSQNIGEVAGTIRQPEDVGEGLTGSAVLGGAAAIGPGAVTGAIRPQPPGLTPPPDTEPEPEKSLDSIIQEALDDRPVPGLELEQDQAAPDQPQIPLPEVITPEVVKQVEPQPQINTQQASRLEQTKIAAEEAYEAWEDNQTPETERAMLETKAAALEAEAATEREKFIAEKMRGESFDAKTLDASYNPISREEAVKKYDAWLAQARERGADIPEIRAEKIRAELQEPAPDVAPTVTQPTPTPVEARTEPEKQPEPEPEPEKPFDAWKATDEERTARQEKVKAGEIEETQDYTHRAYRKGRMFEAVERQDGTWLVRSKPNHLSKFGEWEIQDTVDTQGLRPISRPVVQIKGFGKFKTGEKEAVVPEPKGPPDLLQDLVGQGKKLNRQAFISEFGFDPADTKNVRPVAGSLDGLFTDEGGMTPDALWEWMAESGEYIIDQGLMNNTENETDSRDAVDLLERALTGERIVGMSNDVAEAAYQAALHEGEAELGNDFENEQDNAVDAFNFGSQADENISEEEWDAMLDEAWEKETWHVDEGTVQEVSEQGQAVPETELVPEATTDEKLQAAEEQKTTERNRLGEDEVSPDQGEGELFAGNEPGVRPEQLTIPDSGDVQAQLEQEFSNRDDAWWGVEFSEDGESSFTDSEYSGTQCTGFACAIRKKVGKRAKIYGYSESDNPSAGTNDLADGHDFAVIDDRYIVDPWLTEVESGRITPPKGKTVHFLQSVFDIKEDADLVRKIYGDPNTWTRVTEAEKAADKARGAPTPNKLFTDEAAAEARAYLDSQLGTAFSNPIDPKAYQALVTIAGNKIEKGIRTFDAFSRSMIKEFGDRIKPHLKKLWKDAGGKDQETPDQPQAQERPEPSSGPTTSTKNAVTNAERAARDVDPVMKEARQANPDLIEKAEQAMKNNPDLADEIIDRLNNDPEPQISVLMEAILFIKKVDTRREMRRLAAKAAEGNETSQTKYAELLLRQLEIDQATHASGAVWGRLGQLRSRMMNEDYSFEAQARGFAARQGEPLSDEQSDFIKAQAEQIERLTARLEEANEKAQQARDDFFSEESFDQMKKQVQQQKRTKVSREKQLDRRIAEERAWLRQNMGRAGAGIPADQLVHLSKLGGLLIAKGAATFAKWTKAMKQALGDKLFTKIEGSLKELFEMSLEEDTRIKAEFAQETVEELTVEAEALGEVGEQLTHKLVYDLARALVRSGMRSENRVMAEVHAILSEHFDLPGGERDVRRLFSQYGQATFPSQAADLVRMRELRVLVRLQESIDRLQEGKGPKRTGLQRDKDTQEIRDKNRTLSILKRRYDRENPTPSRDKLASIDQTRITRLENQIADLEKQIKTGEKPTKGEPLPDSAEVTKLKAKRDALKAHLKAIEDAKKIQLTPEEKYNELRAKQLRRDLAETARRLREKDYAKRTRKEPPPLSEANKQLRAELVKAKMKLHEKQADWLRSKLKPHQKAADLVSQSINLSRAVMTSIDLSAVLRQGGFKMMANPRTAIKAFIPMMKALKNDANANAVNDEILSRPNADLYQKAKLHLSEQDSAHPTKMEEVYMGRWQKKVPGVAASGRAYVTFLNKLRADSFDAGIKYFGRKGEVLTLEEMRELAAYINNATGRFDLSKTGKVAGQGLSNIFFAPRWMLSRFAMIMGQPMWNASPRMRKYIALEYARFMLGFSTLFGLAALGFAGNSDDDDDEFWELDPRSTDFGKIKVGNTRLDMMAGLSQPIVFLSRIMSGSKKNAKGEIVPIKVGADGDGVPYGGDTAGAVAWRFMRSKFAPPISAFTNWREGENVVGETYKERGQFMREVLGLPAGIAENPAVVEALGMATPLSMRDFYDALIEHGLPKAAAFQVLATLGVSMNTYDTSGGKKRGRPKRPSRSKRPKRPTRD